MEISQKLNRILSSKKKKKIEASGGEESGTKSLANSCHKFFSKKIEFHTVSSLDSHIEHLKQKYKPLNNPMANPGASSGSITASNNEKNTDNVDKTTTSGDDIPTPKKELFDSKDLEMEWKQPRGIGAGLYNMGNTCFLNSVLQCLVYTPPLYNYINTVKHKINCHAQGFCVLCEFQKHTSKVFNSPNGLVKPSPIVQNLRGIAKQFRQGRQEDAHEFLRYFVDGLQKVCLQGQPSKLDLHSKTTTVIHRIFGGYHRSQVKCLECMKTSDTFDPLLDVSVDIKNCNNLTRAMQKSTQVDTLEDDNSYACPFCKKMTRAQKKVTIHRLPNVLTVQLKRFEYNGMFGGKINKPITYQEHINMRPYMSDTSGPNEWYRLYAVLVHMGYSSNSGHYFCYVKNSNKTWYCMNDTSVSQVSLTSVLSQDAYLLFYIRDPKYRPPESQVPRPPGSSVTAPKKLDVHKSQKLSTTVSHSAHPSPRVVLPMMNKKERSNGNNKAKPEASEGVKNSTKLTPERKLPPSTVPVTKSSQPKPSLPKPTGIVNPSPHSKPPKPTTIPLPPSSVVKSPPPIVTTPTDVSVPPATATTIPSAVTITPPKAPVPSPPAPPTQDDTLPPSSNETKTLPSLTDSNKDYNVPLRKASNVTAPSTQHEPPSKTAVLPTTIPVPVKQQEMKKTPVPKPMFTPRQIANPNSLRNKKLNKLKRPLVSDVMQAKVSELSAPVQSSNKTEGSQVEPIGAVKSIALAPVQMLLSPPHVQSGKTILDVADNDHASDRVKVEGEQLLEEQNRAKQEESLNELNQGMKEVTVAESRSAGLFSCANPVPAKDNAVSSSSSVTGLSSTPLNVPMNPGSKQQKVAMVSPLPQPPPSGTKPVARVKPNLHLSPIDSSSTSKATTEFRRTTSSGFRVSNSLTPSPHLPAQTSKSSPWLVTNKSRDTHESKSKEGIRTSFSEGNSSGWKVTDAPKQVLTSGSEDVFGSSKPFRKKKKKRHRHHSRVSSPSDYSNSDSDWRPSDSKHRKRSYEDRETSRRKYEDRERVRKRSRKDNSEDEDDRYYDRGYDYEGRHHKKHKKLHRRHREERERRKEKERRKHRRHSTTTSYIYSSASDSEGERTFYRDRDRDRDKERDRDRDKERDRDRDRDRDSYRYTEKRRDQHHSSSRHQKHRSPSPRSDEERRRKRDRWYRDNRSRSPVDSKRTKFGSLDHRDGKDATKKQRKVSEVEWDERRAKEREGKSVVKHLTSHSWDKLGDNVLSWTGGENSIDCSSAADEGLRKPVRDAWDQDLDKGKVKKVKKHIAEEFSSGNLFQEYQTKRNSSL